MAGAWVNIADVEGVAWGGQVPGGGGIWQLVDGVFSIVAGRTDQSSPVALDVYLPEGNPYSEYRVTCVSISEQLIGEGDASLNARWFPYNGYPIENENAFPSSAFAPNGAVASIALTDSQGACFQSAWPGGGARIETSAQVRIEVREGGSTPVSNFWTDIVGAFES